MSRIIDITHHKFNKLTVLEFSHIQQGEAFWKCLCDCGKNTTVASYKIRKGKTKSCGCLVSDTTRNLAKRINKLKRKPNQQSAWNKYFQEYKTGAKTRHLTFLLTFEQFKKFVVLSCEYCGRTPEVRNFKNTRMSEEWQQLQDLVVNGLDRVDNSRGYEYSNVVSCCSVCNSFKSNFSKGLFLEQVKKIAKHQESLNV